MCIKMYYKCLSGNEPHICKEFLNFPKKLYDGKMCPQDIGAEKKLLSGCHPLSGDFEIIPLLVKDEKGKAAARGMLTFYPGEAEAYLGFFDSINDIEACRSLIQAAEKIASDRGKTSLVGPIDASIWIGYRFKTDHFDVPYSCEPWNMDYYPRLWEQCGFEIWKRYYSFRMKRITEEAGHPKYEARVKKFRSEGYEITNLDMKRFDEVFREIYDLLIELYSTFPGYKRISYEAFYSLFSNLRLILSPEDVILVYKDNALAAFSICIPNFYENLFGKMTFLKIMRVLRLKKHPEELIALYMGVHPKHLGLGSVMAELLRKQMYKSGCIPIKALIQENKVTGAYYNDLLDEKMEYVLLRKTLR